VINNNDLETISRRIIALYDPESIYLFGSYSKGRATDRSDLDLIIVKSTNPPRNLRGQGIISALSGFAIDLDLVFVTTDELIKECNRAYSFLKTVMPTARLLYKRWPSHVFIFDKGCLDIQNI
jgi:uncharacterized protein